MAVTRASVAQEATEQERDEADEKSMQLGEEVKAAVVIAEARLKIAQEAKAEREALYAKHLPWLLANGDPAPPARHS